MGKKKKDKKASNKKQYPTNVESRAKEAMSIQPPDSNDFKMDNDNTIDKFLRFRPRLKIKYDTLKQKSRMKR